MVLYLLMAYYDGIYFYCSTYYRIYDTVGDFGLFVSEARQLSKVYKQNNSWTRYPWFPEHLQSGASAPAILWNKPLDIQPVVVYTR